MDHMFHDYDTFRLCRELPEDSTIPVGTVGVVLMVFGGTPCAYEVEFPDGKGGNLGGSVSYTISEEFMSPEIGDDGSG